MRKSVTFAWLAALALLLVGLALLAKHWPFTREAVAQAIGDGFSGKVEIGNFRSTYFPHPGCIAESVTLRLPQNGSAQPLATIQKLTLVGSYTSLITLSKRLAEARLEGLRVHLQPGSAAHKSKASKLVIDRVVAPNALLEFAPKQARGNKPLQIEIHRLTLRSVGSGKSSAFEVSLKNPEPPGEITSKGRFGPLRTDHASETPISGSYTFEHADLGVFTGIAGTLSSQGTYKGVLRRIEVDDATEVPDFQLTRTSHKINLSVRYHAVVNGANGDTFLDPAEARLNRTTVLAQGNIAGKPGESGKTVSLDLAAKNGRIQDLLRLFVKADPPPMVGSIAFRAKALLPPENRKFIEKVSLQGDFGIGGADFTQPATQRNIDLLSERARGDKKDDDDPERVVSNVKGHVALKDGVATFSNLSFSVPGAFAQLHGTYNLLNEKIDIEGNLRMEATVSQATKGVKSFLLKAVDPFFKKKGAGAIVPVRIGGTYSHPQVGLDLK